VCKDESKFIEMRECNEDVSVGEGQRLQALKKGRVKIKTSTTEGKPHNIILTNCLFIPNMMANHW